MLPRKYSTERMDLVAADLPLLLAELESPDHLAALLNARVGPGWPPGEYDRGAQEFFRDRMMEGGESVIGWYGWYAVRRRMRDDQPAVVVGAAGFFGPPSESGEVEIGYSIVEAFRNQGFAGEIVGALTEIALTDPAVQLVVARTTPGNLASSAVLRRAGFIQVESGIDAEGNLRFELYRSGRTK